MQILAATDFSTRSHRALRKAGLLAEARGAELTLLHVVDDDQPKDLIELESREAERILAGHISAMAELRAAWCRSMVVAGNPFDGILRSADSIGADLIVMGAHRKQFLRDIFIGTTVERVIRTGPHPVLMVNKEPTGPYRNALAAVDISEPSAKAVRVARSVRLVDGGRTTLLHAFLPLGKRRMSSAGVNQQTINEFVTSERQNAADELRAFLAAHELDGPDLPLQEEEGEPFDAIARVVADGAHDLLILGTHGRTGLLKVLVGSVTEEALRSLDIDIFAVPPDRLR